MPRTKTAAERNLASAALQKCACEGGWPTRGLSIQHDAYFCRACRAWLEARCHDERCAFCAARPSRAP